MSPTDRSMFDGESARVLLCLANARDRSLLADQLASDGKSVVEPDEETLPQFDLCLVDTRTYPRIADELAQRREKQQPVHLPVLLVLGPNDSEAAVSRYAEDVDDVLSVPTSGEVFAWRVNSLLRTRQQSKQVLLFRRAMDDAVTGISICDAGGDQELRYVNDAFLDITGYDRAEVLGRNCRFLQGPETRPQPVRKIREAIDAREPVEVELRNYRKDGTMFWNALEISPVYSEGAVTHFVGFQQDITERVERTQTLTRYEQIVRAAGDPIYALDESLRFALVNEATVELADSPESEILGTHVGTVFGENHANRLESAIDHLREHGAFQTALETTVTTGDGTRRRYETAVAVLPTTEFEGVVCVSRDITDSRERAARLSVLDRVLRHNLRNKLLVVLGQVDSITEATEEGAVLDAATAIETAADELLELADTARKFKQIVDPDAAGTVERTDLAAAVAHAVAEVELEYTDTAFETAVPSTVWARAHDSFGLALTELLYWAAGAADRVSVTVRDSDEQVALVVEHEGQGLKDVERQALNAGLETDLHHTNGLGLWFVRWMAITSGGSFSVTEDDAATSVELTLPRTEAQ